METYSSARFADVIRHTAFGDGRARTMQPGSDGTVTVNIAGLTTQEQGLARAALGEWQAITGLRFRETTGQAQITYTHTGDRAHATTSYSGDTILRATIEIAADRVAPGDGVGSYAFRTYMHETAHALGLGHPQDYGAIADFAQGAIANDSWQMSLMSYFDQVENTAIHASKAYNLTPMLADYLAIRASYGALPVRAGDTVYGVGSTAGGTLDKAAALGARVAFLIADTGGSDTISFSRFAEAQRIDLRAGAISDVMGGQGNMQIATGTMIENAVGGTGNDVLTGNALANLLDGGGGRDTLIGGAGNDTYVVDGDDTVIELPGGGIDTVRAGWGYRMADNVENLVLFGRALTGIGNDLNNTITGTSCNNNLDGRGGADRLIGGEGDDNYVWGTGDVIVELAGGGHDIVRAEADCALAAQVEDLILTGTVVRGWGNGLANRITGNAAANFIDGGALADTLIGGAGNDSYVLTRGDVVVEAAGGGIDNVRSDTSLSLAAFVEHGFLTGSANAAIAGNVLGNRLTGNAGANVIAGLQGNDTLIGNGGVDTLSGGYDDDTYITDGRDVIVELAQPGYDTVFSSGSTALAANLERLNLTGTAAISGIGNAGANTLRGNGAANTLDGAGGNDILLGGAGADRFVFGAGSDRVLDFVDNVDEVVLRGAALGVGSLAEALAAAHDSAAGVVFDFGAHHLLVAHATLAQLRDDLVLA